MWIYLKRILKSGWLNFKRSQVLSVITVFVMFLTISLLTFIFIFKGASDFLLYSLEKKIDVSVYFKEGVSEEEILKTKDLLLEIQGVKIINYVSPAEALAKFKERYKDDDLIAKALEEAGDNPFLASLNITASQVLDYESIAKLLGESRFEGLVSNVDYFQRKPVIEKFFSLKNSLEKTGLAATIILAMIAFSITFVTIRLAIYSSSEEIGIMRLVGASNWFIQGQFIVQGIICGSLAILIALLVFSALSYLLSSRLVDLTGGFNLFNYFLGNFFNILALQVLTGAGLGIISSLVAVRKYLEK